MNFTLTISASPELQAVLEKLAGAKAVTSETTETEEPKTRKQRISKEPPPAAPPVTPPAVENDGLEDDGLGDAKVYTQAEIKTLGREQAARVGADKVRNFITSLGAENLTKLPPEKYNAFAEGVVKLTA